MRKQPAQLPCRRPLRGGTPLHCEIAPLTWARFAFRRTNHDMGYLLVVSLVWAFSFGLIKDNLRGLDASFVAMVRMALSALFFAPMMRLSGVTPKLAAKLMILGAVQYGLMYVLYIASFAYLPAHAIALFTVFTPIFVVLLDNASRRELRPKALVAALIAVIGAAIIGASALNPASVWKGFLLVQGSNVCFALGQVWYRRLDRNGTKPVSTFAFTYFGALIVTLMGVLLSPDSIPPTLGSGQILTLLYLGVIASGLCFFLWNLGATRTNEAVLAVLNNLKIPLAVLVSLVVFGERADGVRLGLATVLMAVALWLGRSPSLDEQGETAIMQTNSKQNA